MGIFKDLLKEAVAPLKETGDEFKNAFKEVGSEFKNTFKETGAILKNALTGENVDTEEPEAEDSPEEYEQDDEVEDSPEEYEQDDEVEDSPEDFAPPPITEYGKKEAETRPKAAFCSECGAKLEPGGKFCSECGASV